MNIVWLFLFIATGLRIAIAAMGHCGEVESYLMLCAQRLDYGFLEGPPGIPTLIKTSSLFLGMTPLGVRFFSPLMMLVASWMLWRLTLSLFPKDKKVATWSVASFNLLPLANASALVMDGTMIVAGVWIIAVVSAWSLISREEKKKSRSSWIFFGLLLAIGTQFTYAIGWLLAVTFLLDFLINRFSLKNVAGFGWALGLLALGWIAPLWWNIQHDMLQFSDITWGSFWSWQKPAFATYYKVPLFWLMPLLLPFFLAGIRPLFSKQRGRCPRTGFLALVSIPLIFYIGTIGHHHAGLPLLLAITTLLLPGAVSLFLKNSIFEKIGLGILLIVSIFSFSLLLGILPPPPHASWNLPSVRGVTGTQQVATELLRLRMMQRRPLPFLIAQTPGLAALVGLSLPITYPELIEAPPVFIPESPAFTSQFQLWPNYADATAKAVVDALYTEEKTTSPFLGRNALYLTEESREDLPETIRRAFEKITPIDQVTLEIDHQKKTLTIYLCESYQMMTL